MADSDAAQAAAAAVLNDMFGVANVAPPPADAEQAMAGVVGDLTAGHRSMKVEDVQARYAAADRGFEMDAVARVAPWRLREPGYRDRALLRAPASAAKPSSDSPAGPQRRVNAKGVDSLDAKEFDRLAEAVYARQAREFEAVEAAEEPIEDVFAGVDQWEHEQAVERARAEAYSEGFVAAQEELERSQTVEGEES